MDTDITRSYDVHAETTGGGTSEALTKQATIPFDSSPRQGDQLPGPADLLTTAFAAVLKNVERMAGILPFGWFNHLAGDRAVAWSGGSEPGSEINPAAVAAMAEVGIDITGEFPKPWTEEIIRAADVVVTMGRGVACPLYPGKRYEDWELDDPAGQDVAAVRPIRDEIRRPSNGSSPRSA